MSRSKRNRGRRGKAPRRHSGTPTVGLALIARNEERDLPTLLTSVEGCFDTVCMVDTGSTDGTVGLFESWARRTGQRVVVEHFDWRDDFAAARQHAQDLLTTDWIAWADADDVLIGGQHLRKLAAEASPDLAGLAFEYVVPMRLQGGGVYEASHMRERLFRRGRCGWSGRVHEVAVPLGGEVAHVPRDVAHWRHRLKTSEEIEQACVRNIELLLKWRREEPDHPLLDVVGEQMLGGLA
jgi:glycosyltransferase involved in cell wall biosynthesis